jgi:hypothetical protein
MGNNLMTKMDKIWIATALLIYPETRNTRLVSFEQIVNEVERLFDTEITPIMVYGHLVSWEDRQVDKDNPSRGGSRNRYLFRTNDGATPASDGKFRLYKRSDGKFDGKDKIGKECPETSMVSPEYRYLLTWYQDVYFPA